MSEEKVLLVNEKDEILGTMPKMEAHEKAVLHRAFSVFVMNKKGQLLLQQKGQLTNTILHFYGLIRVVLIKERAKPTSLQELDA